MSYYNKLQYIAKVDSDDKILDKVERWKAHEEGILHRAITVAVFYEDYAVLQHRKHPVFDNVFDFTVSTHQILVDDIEDDMAAIEKTLERELGLEMSYLIESPVSKGVVKYKAKDPNSKYTENEVCHIYSCQTTVVPAINLEFAYGYSLQKIESITDKKSPFHTMLAPWVKEMLKKNLLSI